MKSIIERCLRNLGCTAHHTTLVKNSFYSGRRENFKLEAVAQLRSCPNGKSYWELVDPDGKPLLPVSFQNRESLLACIASDDFGTYYNVPNNFDNATNAMNLARTFGGVAW